MSDHLRAKHEDELSDNGLATLLSWSAVQKIGITSCPLCSSQGPEDLPELVDHVLQHTYDFALRALPWPHAVVHDLDTVPGSFNLPVDAEIADSLAQWILGAVHESDGPPQLKLCQYDEADHSVTTPLTNPAEYSNYFLTNGYFADSEDKSSRPQGDASMSALSTESGDLVSMSRVQKVAQRDGNGKVINVCISLSTPLGSRWGYLSEQHKQYYIYEEADRIDWRTHMTLKDVLLSRSPLRLNRRQRYRISNILASSFIRLFDTRWLPRFWDKSNILLFQNDPAAVEVSAPYFTRPLMETAGKHDPEDYHDHGEFLEQLGILLLELCFGVALEEQRKRLSYPVGHTESVHRTYDLLVAHDWSEDVEEEAGLAYSDAVAWCLQGRRFSGWREEMMTNVVQPLQKATDVFEQVPLATPTWTPTWNPGRRNALISIATKDDTSPHPEERIGTER